MLVHEAISEKIKKTGCKVFISLITFIFSTSYDVIAQDQAVTFTPDLYNIENTSKEIFRYNTKLANNTNAARVYQLKAEVPDGWRATFKTRGNSITSIKLEAKKTESIIIELKPAFECEPGKYEIPISASSEEDKLEFLLEAVVKGSYAVELDTPTGLISGEIVAGEKMEITLNLRNTGTLPLNDLNLSSRLPGKWESSFEPKKIEMLEPGESTEVTTTLTIPDKTLPGDFMSKLTVKNADANDTIDYRVKVETSVLAGWVGIFIIVVAIGIVILLIRKFGRR